MHRLVILIFLFFNCSSSIGKVPKTEKPINYLFLDVVQKKLIIDKKIPDDMTLLIEDWFSKNVKVNGFDGTAFIEAYSYDEILSNVNDGKKIEISMKLSIQIETKNGLSKKKYIFDIKEFSTITGNFSLNEVDDMVSNTQINLIERMSYKINSQS